MVTSGVFLLLVSHTCIVQTSPKSPLRNNFLSEPVHTLLHHRKPRKHIDSDSLEELHDNFEESPFDEATVHVAPSMISIYSTVETATSRHEEKAVVCLCTYLCITTYRAELMV